MKGKSARKLKKFESFIGSSWKLFEGKTQVNRSHKVPHFAHARQAALTSVCSRARLSGTSSPADVEEQRGYLTENRKFLRDLARDEFELFGCYACAFTSTQQQKVLLTVPR